MSILTSADYPEIRAQLDVTLDSTMLTDATIGLDAFVGEAEREVLTRDPLALTRTGDEAARVRLAAIYLTAARLAPSLPSIVSDQVGDQRVQLQAIDRVQQASRLRAHADEVLDAYLRPSSPPSPAPIFAFGLAHGCRGR